MHDKVHIVKIMYSYIGPIQVLFGRLYNMNNGLKPIPNRTAQNVYILRSAYHIQLSSFDVVGV